MKFKIVNFKDRDIIEKLVLIEEEVFGVNGGADYWLIMAFVRYGLLAVLMEENEIISVAQYMQVLGRKELFLYGFLTRENFRRKGYGKKLIDFCEKKAREIGIESISLTVDPSNEAGIKLYEQKGYEKTEFQKDEYGTGIDRFLMSKKFI